MMKKLIPFFTLILLIFFSACSNLNERTGSISVQFPEGMGARLLASEEIINSSDDNNQPVKVLVKVEGDYAVEISKTYTNPNEIDGQSIEIKNIPVNSVIKASIEIYMGSEFLYKGSSDTITVKTGDNYLEIALEEVYKEIVPDSKTADLVVRIGNLDDIIGILSEEFKLDDNDELDLYFKLKLQAKENDSGKVIEEETEFVDIRNIESVYTLNGLQIGSTVDVKVNLYDENEDYNLVGECNSFEIASEYNEVEINLEFDEEPEPEPESIGIIINFSHNDEYYDLLNDEKNNVEFNVCLYDENKNELESETYSEITAPDNWTVTIGEKVEISAELKINEKILYIGDSGLLEITLENNYVEIELEPQYEKNTIELNLAKPLELKILSNGEVLEGTLAPFETEIAIVAYQDGQQVTFEDSSKTVYWSINGHAIPTDGTEEYGCRLDRLDTYFKNRVTINSEKLVFSLDSDKYLLKLLVSDGDKSASTYLEFTYNYEVPTVENTDIHTPFVLWSILDGSMNTLYVDETSSLPLDFNAVKDEDRENLWITDFKLLNNDIYYKYNGTVYRYSDRRDFIKDCSDYYSDVNTGTIYYVNNGIYKSNNGNNTRLQVPDEFLRYVGQGKFAITENYAASCMIDSYNSSLNLKLFYNNGNFLTKYSDINILKDVIKLDYHTQVKEMMIINDVLYMLVSRFVIKKDGYINYPGILEQYGALVAVDLRHPRNVRYIGLDDTTTQHFTGYKDNNAYNLDVVGPTVTKNMSSETVSFYAPQRIVAIREKYMYIADYAYYFEEQENDKLKKTNINRIVKVNLADFSIEGDVFCKDDGYELVNCSSYTYMGSTGYDYW